MLITSCAQLQEVCKEPFVLLVIVVTMIGFNHKYPNAYGATVFDDVHSAVMFASSVLANYYAYVIFTTLEGHDPWETYKLNSDKGVTL